MGTDGTDIAKTLPNPYSFKVHNSMCVELMKLVDRIAEVFPKIEEARPRCSSGIQALCSLNGAIERARQRLQYCRDSSKLYLAITGDAMVDRFQRVRKMLEQSLGQVQTMVPPMLAAEINEIIGELRGVKLVLDSSVEGAGKALRELLQLGTSASDSVEYSEIKALQLAASRLHITSPRAIVIEKRSIKKLLDSIANSDPPKKKILNYLLHLLKKYGNLIIAEQSEIPKAQPEGFLALEKTIEVEPCAGCEQSGAQSDMLCRATPPEEFKCPISMRIMYDPVVIASGQTFERMCIQKWFDLGNDTCPKTKVKLVHRSLTPNATIKDLISKWCSKYGVTIDDPSLQAFQSLDISNTSIASLGSFVNDLNLPVDISNVSLGSLDASYGSGTTCTRVTDRSRLVVMQKADDSPRYKSANMNEIKFLFGLAELPWECKCKTVEDVKNYLQSDDQVCHSLSPENSVGPLIKFLRDALHQNDVRAQRTGSQLLLVFVRKNRSGVSDLHEDAFNLLSSFLDSEVIDEALSILEVLSGHPYCRPKITASGALVSILKILDCQIKELQEQAIKILLNLSSDNSICSQIISLEYIPKLVPFINDGNLARYCIVILKNLCKSEEARVSVAETHGCIASISQLLESDCHEYQEHAVDILLSLCSQRVQYCKLVMDEGVNVVPSLVHVSVNGNSRGKVLAQELLRQLRNIEYVDQKECFGSAIDAGQDASYQSKEKKSSSKPSGFFKTMFSKTRSHPPKKK